uniref:Uncharacterized protein n=1 Tax=Anguilla anguilla TaxID=7936 RepID=A0A0E9SJW7_ANGAN
MASHGPTLRISHFLHFTRVVKEDFFSPFNAYQVIKPDSWRL